ncbi:MAG: hypothetical protein HQL52_11070 [Magnetococcales bacterium]|nr:hypothetical protein [Magnetococcales bacterium]
MALGAGKVGTGVALRKAQMNMPGALKAAGSKGMLPIAAKGGFMGVAWGPVILVGVLAAVGVGIYNYMNKPGQEAVEEVTTTEIEAVEEAG